MIDDLAKGHLLGQLRPTRQVLVWKLDGLGEYEIRRPLTATGTNLLGLIKHLATWEARYLGGVFDRPFPEPLLRWQDADGSDLWVTPAETREQIIDFCQRAWVHADAPRGAPGQDRAGCAGSDQRLASRRPVRHAWRDGDAVRNADLVEARR